MRAAEGWPELSPGSVNAWLLLVTTKPPAWRDTLIEWVERPPTLGVAHEGFFYPDPLGFWAEIRHWSTLLVRLAQPGAATADALAVTSLIHVGDKPRRIVHARELMRPRVVLFLDEPAWTASGLHVRQQTHYVPDPHREGQVYEGFWATGDDGTVIGKAPQHPATHKLYRTADMDGFLAACPV